MVFVLTCTAAVIICIVELGGKHAPNPRHTHTHTTPIDILGPDSIISNNANRSVVCYSSVNCCGDHETAVEC